MQDNENNEPIEDIEDVELDDDSLEDTEHQDDPSNAETESDEDFNDLLREDEPEKKPEKVNPQKDKIISSWVEKIVSGERTLEDVEKHPALSKWALEPIRNRVELKVNEYSTKSEIKELRERLNKFEEMATAKEIESDKSKAQELVKNFYVSQGFDSYKDFAKANPEFVEDYQKLKKTLGMSKAAQLSLNNIIAQEYQNTNYSIRNDMKTPISSSTNQSNNFKFSKSGKTLASAWGISPDKAKELLEFKKNLSR